MEKNQLMLLVNALHQEMKELTIQAGVKENTYIAILEYADQATESELMDLHTWLLEIRDGSYDNVLKVWERHTPETWSMLHLMEVFHLAEQKLLRKNYQSLCKAWREHGFKKKKRAKSNIDAQGSTEVSVRSEETGADESSG
jgi:hypothetical protein